MTKKNRKQIQGKGQHQGVVSKGVNPPPAPPISEKQKPAEKVPASTVSPLLLTVADVCALLNISRSTLFRLEQSGGLPGRVKLGGQVRYHRETIEEWLRGIVKDQHGQENQPSP